MYHNSNPQDATTATVFNNCIELGKMHSGQGRYSLAVEQFKQALFIIIQDILNENQFNKIHIAAIMDNIGTVYIMQGEYDKAIEQFNQAMIQVTLGDDRCNETARILHNLGYAYCLQGKHDQAIEYYTQTLAIQRAALGECHTEIANTICSIGGVYHSQGKYDQAIEQYTKALDMHRKAATTTSGEGGGLPYDDANTAHALLCIGCAYSCLKKRDLAIEYLTRAMDIKLTIFGNNHHETAAALNQLGIVYNNKKMHGMAIECYTRALAIHRSPAPSGVVHNNNHIEDILRNMGDAYNSLKMHDIAMEQYTEAFAITNAKFGENHSKTLEITRDMELCIISSKKYNNNNNALWWTHLIQSSWTFLCRQIHHITEPWATKSLV